MEFICDRDYEYIRDKYFHFETDFSAKDEKAYINGVGMERFNRVDANFDENTGLPCERIKEMILEQDERNEELPHAVRKAMALRLVLQNTRIRCDERDIFPAVNCIDRPLDATIIQKWRREIFENVIPENNAKRVLFCDECIATIWPDYCHSVPNFERMLSLGFAGLLRESEEARAKSENTAEEEAFFEGVKLSYEAMLEFVGRLRRQAEGTAGCEKMAKALGNLEHSAPDSFYEACLLVYIYFIVSEHVDGIQMRSLSNFDRQYYPFWVRDLERGVSEDELKKQLAYYIMQYAAINNYWGQPIYLGGTKENGETEINPLSYIFLDVYDKMGVYNPKIQLKVSPKNTPKEFLLKALDMIRRGNNSIVFVCEDTINQMMVNSGVPYDLARRAVLSGCYEFGVPESFGTGMNYVNMLKPLEYALNEGRDGVSGREAGLKCPPVSDYTSFEQLVAEYKRQLKYIVENIVEIVNGFEDYLYLVDPTSLVSGTYKHCLEAKKDAIGGGGITNSDAIMFGFLADLTDSLAMIKKHVFDKKTLTFEELKSALDANFVGYEKLRMKLLLDPDKYGNNRDLPDNIAVDITDYARDIVHGNPTCRVRNGQWYIGFHVARQSYDQAPKTATSPNGRLIGEELSKNVSASMGQNREGATAAILSATKLHSATFTGDLCLDLGLLPSAVAGDDGLMAMYGLLQTFLQREGHAMHINVFSAEKLRAAQREPEKYRDLQIRVCGWNVLFNNINKVEQDGFIRQAESLV